ncbi:MAG TPA: TauD/TfdA family dioxygenase [Solirubrobacteraceae bacterium]|nr:TauD/TfdA family dioxygenase [Solirubrobacteraceae bacterium]
MTDASGRTWSIADAGGATFDLSAMEAADLAYVAHRLASEHDASTEIDDHELLVNAEVAARRASPDLVAALVHFRLQGSRDGILLLRGLPIDEPLPATPDRGAFTGSWLELSRSTISQLVVMSMLGDVISYADEKDGRLIQDICPIPGAEELQENTGSALLELHTEDGFHPNKPDFLSLLALRSDHAGEAMTVACGIRAVLPDLDEAVLDVLRQPLYRIRLASSFVGNGVKRYSPPMPVLSGCPHDPELCVDFHAMEAMTPGAAYAFEDLRERMLDSLVGVALAPGEMLIVDNRKAVHGRTGFAPRYDGEDRWLRRCFAVADIRASHPMRYPASRVHRPLEIAVH